MSSAIEIGKLLFPTFFAKVTESLICLHTMDTLLILVFILIVPITMRSIELFGVIM
ncbi:hypothetical protein LINPERHAP1_LOCUS23965 [Linum perenne]